MGVDLFAPMGSAESRALAQRYPNVTWGCVVVGAVGYYFWGPAGAAVPALFAVWAGWQSVKATARANKWEKVEQIRAQAGEGGRV